MGFAAHATTVVGDVPAGFGDDLDGALDREAQDVVLAEILA